MFGRTHFSIPAMLKREIALSLDHINQLKQAHQDQIPFPRHSQVPDKEIETYESEHRGRSV